MLSDLQLVDLVNASEFVLLYRKFDIKVGGRNDINYSAFCDMIEDPVQSKRDDPVLRHKPKPF